MENKNIVSDAVIRVRGLKKDFDNLAVLKGIDVDIHKGDVEKRRIPREKSEKKPESPCKSTKKGVQ